MADAGACLASRKRKRSSTDVASCILCKDSVGAYIVRASQTDPALWRMMRLVNRFLSESLGSTPREFTFAVVKHRTEQETRLEVQAVKPNGFADDVVDGYRFLAPVAVAWVHDDCVLSTFAAHRRSSRQGLRILLGCNLRLGGTKLWGWAPRLDSRVLLNENSCTCLHFHHRRLLGVCGKEDRFMAFFQDNDGETSCVVLTESEEPHFVALDFAVSSDKMKFECVRCSSTRIEVAVFTLSRFCSTDSSLTVRTLVLERRGGAGEWRRAAPSPNEIELRCDRNARLYDFDVQMRGNDCATPCHPASTHRNVGVFDLYTVAHRQSIPSMWGQRVIVSKQRCSVSLPVGREAHSLVLNRSEISNASICIPSHGTYHGHASSQCVCRHTNDGGVLFFVTRPRRRQPAWFKESVSSIYFDTEQSDRQAPGHSVLQMRNRLRHWTWLPANDELTKKAAHGSLEDVFVVVAPLSAICAQTRGERGERGARQRSFLAETVPQRTHGDGGCDNHDAKEPIRIQPFT